MADYKPTGTLSDGSEYITAEDATKQLLELLEETNKVED